MESLYLADNITVLGELDDNSLDSCVTDPPYGIKLLGAKWDYQIPSVDLWKELLRVLKPGAHALIFCGTRTQHRMASNIEDAGFEIRDVITWLYGQGYPKSYDLGKYTGEPTLSGWGTALKPACEFITLARKPISTTTLTDNVLVWGTGGLNIDDSKIELNGEVVPINKLESWSGFGQIDKPNYTPTVNTSGRWPANLLLDNESGKLIDEQSGVHASRFFYCSKPSMKERNSGAENLEPKPSINGTVRHVEPKDRPNNHPSVKPIKLMEYLVRLVTPKEGVCIDPFMGSGTTGIACKNLDMDFIGIERDEGFFEIAKERINNA